MGTGSSGGRGTTTRGLGQAERDTAAGQERGDGDGGHDEMGARWRLAMPTSITAYRRLVSVTTGHAFIMAAVLTGW